MDHLDVRVILELATVEPGGLARLEAGDTPESAAAAAHLAGCASCAEELGRLRRVDELLRPALADAPDPELRDRTLAFVRAVGRPRGTDGMPRGVAARDVAARDIALRREPGRGPGRLPAPAWLAAAAILVVAAFGAGILLAGRPTVAPGGGDTLAALTRAQAEILAAPDAIQVALVDASGIARGTLAAAPSSGRIAVAATGLAGAPDGREYRCWVEAGGTRTRLGTMWFAGDVAWWAGPAPLPASLPAGTTFGISLAGTTGDSLGEAVLVGSP